MGSLCCVAARPHGSNTASRDWSLGPHEPFWHTNTSFSPPPSRWDIQFQSEGLPHGWHDAVQLYGSSTSSNSKESRSWIRGNNHIYTHNSASDGAGLFLSSPSDISQGPQWTPPAIQEINIDGYETATKRGTITVIASSFSIVLFLIIVTLWVDIYIFLSQVNSFQGFITLYKHFLNMFICIHKDMGEKFLLQMVVGFCLCVSLFFCLYLRQPFQRLCERILNG